MQARLALSPTISGPKYPPLFSNTEQYPLEGKVCLFKPNSTPAHPVSVLSDNQYQEGQYVYGFGTADISANTNVYQAQAAVIGSLDEHASNHAVFNRNRDFALARLRHLPNKIRISISEEYQRRLTNKDGIANIRGANIYLRTTTEFINKVWLKYPFHNAGSFFKKITSELREDVPKNVDLDKDDFIRTTHLGGFELIRYRKSKQMKQVANRLALIALDEVKDAATHNNGDMAFLKAYDAAAAICQQWDIPPPYYAAVKIDFIIPAAECAILRMTCPKWWLKKLSNLRDRCTEHMNIAAGLVNEGSPYISRDSFNEWCEQQKSGLEWLESTMIESESGVIIPLIDAAMSGTANPKNRFVEMVVRARGLEEVAEDLGYIGFMANITAPSKYHRNSKKWNAEDPRYAQQFLVKQWAKVRTALTNLKIKFKGFRIVEPHKDGTPHWHMMIFVHSDTAETTQEIITKYAFEVDGDEDGAKEHRLVFEPIDKIK
ncbi:replication endonuclease, partial [Shewanella sp. D64]